MFEHGYIHEKNASHPETHGWFIGPFIDATSAFYNENFEAKWMSRKA